MAIALTFSLMPNESRAQNLAQKCCEGRCCTGSTICDNCDRSCCPINETITSCSSCKCVPGTACYDQCIECKSISIDPDLDVGKEVDCTTCDCMPLDSNCAKYCQKCPELTWSYCGQEIQPIECATAGDDVYDCSTNQPTCASLGFTMSASDCTGAKSIKCPFDLSKLFCFRPDCTSGEEWCDKKRKCMPTCDGFISLSGGLIALCSKDETQIDCTDCLGNQYYKCIKN